MEARILRKAEREKQLVSAKQRNTKLLAKAKIAAARQVSLYMAATLVWQVSLYMAATLVWQVSPQK